MNQVEGVFKNTSENRLHAGRDFFMGPVLGFSVSGMQTQCLVKQTISGPDWLTGDEFGPDNHFRSVLYDPVDSKTPGYLLDH